MHSQLESIKEYFYKFSLALCAITNRGQLVQYFDLYGINTARTVEIIIVFKI